jgi:hypothetical protein
MAASFRVQTMTNINGKAYAMNVISPMKPWRSWILRGFFFILGHIKSMQKDLVNLSFIHFARWVIVPRSKFPYLGARQKPEQLQYDYLLFFSNFNGTWNQYIDAFSAVLSRGLNAIWGQSVSFVGAAPVTPFKRQIARCQFDTDYYFTAYPYATTNDVKAAHRVESAVQAFAANCSTMQPAEFATAYQKLLVATQGDLGETSEPPVGT